MQDKTNINKTSDSTVAVSIGGLIDDHHATVYRYAFRMAGQQSDAEDITQQTFLIAHQKLSQLKKPSAARSWLMTIARNCFLKRLRAKTAVAATDVDVDVKQIEQPKREEDSLASSLSMNAVEAAIRELDDHHRLVIMMFYFEKLSYKQIATHLDVAVGTVMSRLSRAKIKLRDVLSAENQGEESGRISG